MDDTLLKYDESLEALERQREDLELVMKKMGAEWEESGAGIGWMGDILYNSNNNTSLTNNINTTPPPIMSLMHSVTSSSPEPSQDYLQTLFNVNDELLAQSLNKNSNNNNTHDTSANVQHPQLLKSTLVSQQQPISPHISK